jgi:hypothetical protein
VSSTKFTPPWHKLHTPSNNIIGRESDLEKASSMLIVFVGASDDDDAIALFLFFVFDFDNDDSRVLLLGFFIMFIFLTAVINVCARAASMTFLSLSRSLALYGW